MRERSNKPGCDTSYHVYSDLCQCKTDDLRDELYRLREKVGKVLLMTDQLGGEYALEQINKTLLGDKT